MFTVHPPEASQSEMHRIKYFTLCCLPLTLLYRTVAFAAVFSLIRFISKIYQIQFSIQYV